MDRYEQLVGKPTQKSRRILSDHFFAVHNHESTILPDTFNRIFVLYDQMKNKLACMSLFTTYWILYI